MKIITFFLLTLAIASNSNAYEVRLKNLARIEGNREVALIGYGIVVGLSGTGDSQKNKVTLQSLANTLSRFGLEVEENDLNAKNVAAVIVTAELPRFGEPGDRIDVSVASTGDARSLAGGTLLLCPLYGPDQRLYALAQGSLIVGGYETTSYSNKSKKNQTTVGRISNGASVEQSPPNFQDFSGKINILLNKPDYTTASRIVEKIRTTLTPNTVTAVHPGKIEIELNNQTKIIPFISKLENIQVSPDIEAKVVVNERTGIVVAGSDVTIGDVSIIQGSLKIEIETSFGVYQPQYLVRPSDSIGTTVVPDTSIKLEEETSRSVTLKGGTTVGDLVNSLKKIKLSTRDTISILESIKAAGALHAELIIQ